MLFSVKKYAPESYYRDASLLKGIIWYYEHIIFKRVAGTFLICYFTISLETYSRRAEGLNLPVYGRPDHRTNLQPLNKYCFLMDNRGIVCLYLLIRSTPNRNWRWKTLSVPPRQELGSGKPQRNPLVVNTVLQANTVFLNGDSPFMSSDTETPLRCSAFQFHCSS